MHGIRKLFDECVDDIQRITQMGKDGVYRSPLANTTEDQAIDFIIMFVLTEKLNEALFPIAVLEKNSLNIAVKKIADKLRPHIPMKMETFNHKEFGKFQLPIPDQNDFQKIKESVKKIIYKE